MISIDIIEKTSTTNNMASLLHRIAELIDEGYICGFSPDWKMVGEEELDELDSVD